MYYKLCDFYNIGNFGALLTTGKIVIKNKNVRSTLKIIETMSLFLLTCLCVVGRRFFGRRGAVLFNALGKQKSSVFFCVVLWLQRCFLHL